MKSFFTPKEISSIIEVTYRQLTYWDKTSFIKPSYRRKGKYRLYTFADLIQLKVAIELRVRGYSIQMLRTTIQRFRSLLPQVTKPLAEYQVIIEDGQVSLLWGEMIQSDPSKAFKYRFGDLVAEIEQRFPQEDTSVACAS